MTKKEIQLDPEYIRIKKIAESNNPGVYGVLNEMIDSRIEVARMIIKDPMDMNLHRHFNFIEHGLKEFLKLEIYS